MNNARITYRLWSTEPKFWQRYMCEFTIRCRTLVLEMRTLRGKGGFVSEYECVLTTLACACHPIPSPDPVAQES